MTVWWPGQTSYRASGPAGGLFTYGNLGINFRIDVLLV